MNITAQANLDWMQALGVTADPNTVVGVTLRLRGGKLPLVTVHQDLCPGKPAGQVVRRYVLVPAIEQTDSSKSST
jgi:hypothetical protein